MNKYEEKKKILDDYLKEALFFYDLPALSVSASVGDFKFREVAGYADYEKKEEVKEGDFFHLASVSKTFVSSAIMKLVSEGKICLDTKLIDILPWIKIDDNRLEEITIKEVISHTAGIGDVENYNWDKPQIDEGALKRYVTSDEVKNSKLLWSPSENKFKYSNIGYEILGCVISEVSKMPFEEYIKETFFIPLGMNNSTFLTFERGENIEDKIKNLDLDVIKKAGGAMPHYKDKENHICLEKVYPYNREHGPSSTLTSRLEDMEKWAEAAIERKLFDKEIYDNMWNEKTEVPNNGEKMGLGWFIRKQGGKTLYGHEGTDDGFRASFWVCPEEKAYVIVMSNLSQAPVKKINKGFFERLCL